MIAKRVIPFLFAILVALPALTMDSDDSGHFSGPEWEPFFLLDLSQVLELAERGVPRAQAVVAMEYYSGKRFPKDLRKSLYWANKAAEAGVVEAQGHLGFQYYHGEGVPKDHVVAAFWFKKAAESGNRDAQDFLGMMYEEGTGVPKSHQQAVYWYKRASEQGKPLAQRSLGIKYALGEGAEKNYVLAWKWLSLSLSYPEKEGYQGTTQASLDYLEERMTPDQLAEAKRLTREFAPKPERPEEE